MRQFVAFLTFLLLAGSAVAAETSPQGVSAESSERARSTSLSIDVLSKPVLSLRVREGWDTTEKTLLWSYVALSAVDTYQTIRQPVGFREANPLVAAWAGDRPSAGEVLMFKAATTYGLLRLAQRIPPERGKRKIALAMLNALQLSVDVRNERVTGGIVFHPSR